MFPVTRTTIAFSKPPWRGSASLLLPATQIFWLWKNSNPSWSSHHPIFSSYWQTLPESYLIEIRDATPKVSTVLVELRCRFNREELERKWLGCQYRLRYQLEQDSTYNSDVNCSRIVGSEQFSPLDKNLACLLYITSNPLISLLKYNNYGQELKYFVLC